MIWPARSIAGALLFFLQIALCQPASSQGQWPVFMHDRLHSGMAFSAGPKTPELLWTFQTGGPITTSPVIDAAGRIYIGSDKLYCLDPDGSLVFEFSALDDISSTAAVSEQLGVMVGSYDGYFYWLSMDGQPFEDFYTGAYNQGAPTIGSDGTVYFGSWSKSLYAFDAPGSLLWSYEAYDWFASSPAIGPDGTIYAGCDDRRLYAITPYGKLKWSYVGFDWISGSAALGVQDTILVPGWDNTLTCLDSEGNVFWQYTVFGDVRSSPAVFADGSIFFGSYDGYLYCLRPEGKTRWSYDVQSQIYASCALDVDSNCYFGTLDGTFYSLDSSGALRWTFEVQEPIISSCAISDDGTLYFGSLDGKLYALGGGLKDYEPRIGIHINQAEYSLWETMSGFYYIVNPTRSPLTVDVYLAVWTGEELFFYPGLTTQPSCLASNVSIEPLSVRRSGEVIDYTFAGAICEGRYWWFIGMTRAGSLELEGRIGGTSWEFH